MTYNDSALPQTKPLGSLYKWLRIFFIAYIVCEFLTLFGSAYVLAFGGYILGPQYNYNIGEIILGFGGLGFLIAFIGSIITFCIFSFRSVKNIRIWDEESIDITPGWSVGWYFIPIANLWKPYHAMTDIWYGSHKVNDENWETPFYMPIWWLCWIVMNIISNISFRMSLRAGYMEEHVSNVSLYRTTLVMDIVSAILGVLAAYFILKILQKIADKQDARISTEAFL